jgi:hypothetical protein
MKLKLTRLAVLGAVFLLLPHLLAAEEISQPYCSIFNQIENLNNRIIKTNALMFYSTVSRVDGDDTFLYSPHCNKGDYFATVDFSNLKNSGYLRRFLTKLPGEKNFILEIYFTGKLQTSLTPAFGHLSWAIAEMNVFDVTSIKDVTALPNTIKPDYEAATPLKSKGTELQSINSQILFFFVFGDKSSYSQDIERYISDDFTVIDKLGRTFGKNNYLKLIKEGFFKQVKEVGIERGRVKKLKDENYVISGKIENTVKGIKKESLNYENNFQFSEEKGWMLMKIKFSGN